MVDPFSLAEAQNGEPVALTKGQSAMWRREIDIDPTLFTIAYQFRNYDASDATDPSGYSIPLTSVSSGVFGADVSPTVIATWDAGTYFWDMVVTRVSDSRTTIIETGEIRIFADGDERRSHAQIMVAKIESLLENRADNDVDNYAIKSRSITKMSVAELREWREYYMREVANQPNTGMFAAPKTKTNRLRVRFLS